MKSKYKKILEKWKNGNQDGPITEVETVLDEFFPGQWGYSKQSGSHSLYVEDDSFIGIGKINRELFRFTIPSTNGKKVKPFYLKSIVKAVEIKLENENENK